MPINLNTLDTNNIFTVFENKIVESISENEICCFNSFYGCN